MRQSLTPTTDGYEIDSSNTRGIGVHTFTIDMAVLTDLVENDNLLTDSSYSVASD